MKHELIRQPYNLTIARYTVNIHEQRILVRILQALQKGMSDDPFMTIRENLFQDKIICLPTSSLIPKGSTNYTHIKKALKSLREKTIEIRGYQNNKAYVCLTGLILKSKYFQNNEKVQIHICKDLLPFYCCLAKGFTKYSTSTFFNISSPHTLRIYQELCHWASNKVNKIIYFEDFKKILNVECKYKLSGNFKQAVLLSAQKELKEKADVWFDIIGEVKEGRKVVGWKVKILLFLLSVMTQ